MCFFIQQTFIEHLNVLYSVPQIQRENRYCCLRFSWNRGGRHLSYYSTNKAIIAKLGEKAQHKEPVQGFWYLWGWGGMCWGMFLTYPLGPIQENPGDNGSIGAQTGKKKVSTKEQCVHRPGSGGHKVSLWHRKQSSLARMPRARGGSWECLTIPLIIPLAILFLKGRVMRMPHYSTDPTVIADS